VEPAANGCGGRRKSLAAIESGGLRAANPIANLIADDGAKHDRQESHLRGITPAAEKIPGGDKRESPGRKKADEKPVSMKTIVQMGSAAGRINSLSPSEL